MSPTTITTFDALVGPFAATTHFDALVETPDRTTWTHFDAKVCGQTRTRFDALVSDPRGTYRGVVSTTTDRDALPNLPAGDIVDVQQGTGGKSERHYKTSSSRLLIMQDFGTDPAPIGSDVNHQGYGQSFEMPGIGTVSGVDIYVHQKVGSPGDNIVLEVLSGSMTGTVLASKTLAASALVAGYNLFTFASPPTLDPAGDPHTRWYIRVTRSGSLDASNYVELYQAYRNGFDRYIGGTAYLDRPNANHVALTESTGPVASYGVGKDATHGGEGQSWQLASAEGVIGVDLFFNVNVGVGRIGSPADNLLVELMISSISGTAVASAAVAAPSITLGAWNSWIFPDAVYIPASTTAYFRVTRTGALDASNYMAVSGNNSGNPYANGQRYAYVSGAWASQVNQDLIFKIRGADYAWVDLSDAPNIIYSDLRCKVHLTVAQWQVALNQNVAAGVINRLDSLVRDDTGTSVYQQPSVASPDKESI